MPKADLYFRWYSHFANVPDDEIEDIHPTIWLAMMKLGPGDFARDSEAKLACLDCRVLLQFHPLRANSLRIQDVFIRTKMRVVFNIPGLRHFPWSGYPSELMLAEAAARLLNESNDIINEVPRILQSAVESGFLARGDRGELVARTLRMI
jgi:hypothetical protein